MEGPPEMANNSSAAKKAEAKPATTSPAADNTAGTPDPSAPANTADQPTPGDGNDTSAQGREAQAKAAEDATVEAGPKPGTDEFAQQYTDTMNQLAKTADPVEAPEGTPEHEAYTPPAEGK